MMKTYSATIRLNGSLLNEVEKFGLTVPEIHVLRHIHGEDSVVNLFQRKKVNRAPKADRVRLDELYGPHVTQEVFGVGVGNMPQDLDDEDEARIKTSAQAKKAAAEKDDEDFDAAVEAEVQRRMKVQEDAKKAEKAVATG